MTNNAKELTFDVLDQVSAGYISRYLPPRAAEARAERAERASVDAQIAALESFKMPSFSFF
jgi:hypothetical protein